MRVTGDSLDSLFDEYFSEKTDEEKVAIRKKFGTQQAVRRHQRIRRVYRHFEALQGAHHAQWI